MKKLRSRNSHGNTPPPIDTARKNSKESVPFPSNIVKGLLPILRQEKSPAKCRAKRTIQHAGWKYREISLEADALHHSIDQVKNNQTIREERGAIDPPESRDALPLLTR